MSEYSMTKAGREAFLAATRVAVLSIERPGRAPLTVPIWFSYVAGGDVLIATHGTSIKAKLLRAAGRASLCVQDDKVPYKYVSVEGPVSIEARDCTAEIRAMAHRYMGEQGGEMFMAMTAEQRAGEVMVRLKPQHWLSVDYGKTRA